MGNENEWRGLDPANGEVKRTFPMVEMLGCWRDLATERFFIAGRPPDFVAWKDGQVHPFDGTRNSCKVGALVANNLYYTVPNKCTCVNDQIRGFVSFGSERPLPAANPLETGPALASTRPDEPSAPPVTRDSDWPTFRHDSRRSNCTNSVVPAGIELLWEATIDDQRPPGELVRDDWAGDPIGGDPLTGPVVADGMVYVCATDSHRIAALDAETGKVKWTYAAGGRLDTPPTIFEGRCLFGCRDGWVYCLGASDGKLAWRFRAAPEERKIVAFGQLESIWPVVGGVLVENGRACFAAGRSTASGGGIHIYAVDPASGRLLWRKTQVKTPPSRLRDPSQTCADVLVSDGRNIAVGGNALCLLDGQTGDLVAGQPAKADILHTRHGAPVMDRSWHWFEWGAYISGELCYGNVDCPGQLLAFSADRVYLMHRTCYWPIPANKGTMDSVLAAADIAKNRGVPARNVKTLWETPSRDPLQFQAMIVAGNLLFAGGPVDRRSPKEGELWVVSAEDGKVLKQLKLLAAPVAEGLAAAGGRLYVSTADRKVLCFGKR